MKGAEVPELKGEYSDQLKAVIKKCLETNPWERPTADQLGKYAEDGLQNKKIVFYTKKTIWQKYKFVVICAAVIVMIGGVAIKLINKYNEAIEKEYIAKAIAAENDSIKQVVTRYELIGDSLRQVGDTHDEWFETAYIESLQIYNEAQGAIGKLTNDTRIKNEALVKAKISDVEAKLYIAYKSFKEKAMIFADDPEIAAEFNNRAKKIGEVIDLKKFEKSEGQTDIIAAKADSIN
jgi:hypothetical protein